MWIKVLVNPVQELKTSPEHIAKRVGAGHRTRKVELSSSRILTIQALNFLNQTQVKVWNCWNSTPKKTKHDFVFFLYNKALGRTNWLRCRKLITTHTNIIFQTQVTLHFSKTLPPTLLLPHPHQVILQLAKNTWPATISFPYPLQV